MPILRSDVVGTFSYDGQLRVYIKLSTIVEVRESY